MTCPTGKRQFPQERDALEELAVIIKESITGERRRERLECAVFECYQCTGWHLTSKPATSQLSYRRNLP